MALRNLFGKGGDLDALPGELRGLLEDMRRERSAFEAGLVRQGDALKAMEALAPRAAEAQQQLAALTERLAALEGLGATVVAVESGAQASREQLDTVTRTAASARTDLDELRRLLQEALALKPEVARLLESQERISAIAEQVRGMAEGVADAERRHAQAQRDGESAVERLADIERRFDRIQEGVEATASQAEAFQRTAEDLRTLVAELPNVKRELGTLRAMADVVTPKVAALEGQRDAVERAMKNAERLTELMAQVDRQLQEQQSNSRFISQLEEQVGQLKELHGTLLEQTEEIGKRQKAITADIGVQREIFEDARSAVQDALAGFAFEREGLAAMSHRVTELREALRGFEQRIPALDAAGDAIQTADATAAILASRITALSEEVESVASAAAALRGLRGEAQRVEATARALIARAEGLGRPAVESLETTEARVADLNRALEGLERRAQQVEANRTQAGSELAAHQAALDHTLQQLERVTALREDVAGLIVRLEQDAGTLRSNVTEASEASQQSARQLETLGERTEQIEALRSRLERFAARFATLTDAEDRIERALARAQERQSVVEAVQKDLARLFEIADNTSEQVRGIAVIQKELEEKRSVMEEAAAKLRDIDRQSERIEQRQQQFDEAEQRLARLDAHVSGLQTTLDSVIQQKEFLDKVLETAGSLAFQTMQAESAIATLREEREVLEKGKTGRKKTGP